MGLQLFPLCAFWGYFLQTGRRQRLALSSQLSVLECSFRGCETVEERFGGVKGDSLNFFVLIYRDA